MKDAKITELEKELRSYKPCELSDAVKQRIAEHCREAGQAYRFQRLAANRAAQAALAAAAVLLVILSLFGWARRGDKPAIEASGTAPVLARAGRETATEIAKNGDPPRRIVVERIFREPVELDSVLIAEHDEGTVLVSSNRPYRRVRHDYVDHMRWHDPEQGVRYSVTAPRSEVVLVSMDPN